MFLSKSGIIPQCLTTLNVRIDTALHDPTTAAFTIEAFPS